MKTLPEGDRFYCNVVKAFGWETSIPRYGEWLYSWQYVVMPGNEMPLYDPNFNLIYQDVTDIRAKDIADLIEKNR